MITRTLRSQPLLHIAGQKRHLTCLAIETSCDDTCVALLRQPTPDSPCEVISNLTHRSLHLHEQYGGLHPLVSVHSHIQNLSRLIRQTVDAHMRGPDGIKVDLVAVTRGPGMQGCLAVGMNHARALAAAWGCEYIGVHHMQAHALTPRLVSSGKGPEFPYFTLLLSGGHTQLVHSKSLTDHTVLTDAYISNSLSIGCLFDRTAKALEVKWDGKMPGAALEKWSWGVNPDPEYPMTEEEAKWKITLPLNKPKHTSRKGQEFSLTGIEAWLFRFLKRRKEAAEAEGLELQPLELEEGKGLARAIQRTAFKHVMTQVLLRLQETSPTPTSIVVSGGVASNMFLRTYLRQSLDAAGFKEVELVFPPVSLCTDNAPMIGWAGMEMWREGWRMEETVLQKPKWSLERLLEEDKDAGGYTRVRHNVNMMK
ncbi:Mitochondrial tRNAs modification protein [Saitoella coloradoensis]